MCLGGVGLGEPCQLGTERYRAHENERDQDNERDDDDDDERNDNGKKDERETHRKSR